MTAKIELPYRPFLYTLDQIATLTAISVQSLKDTHLYFAGRTEGVRNPDLLVAHNIVPPPDKPDWRVEEREFLRWLKRKGFLPHVRRI